MNILMLFNDFDGAYGSLELFQKEIISSISDKDKVFISYSPTETVNICHDYTITFSLGIGAFNQYIKRIPVYDVTGVKHFQWIIDNPLKMDIDDKSSLITYILINKGFVYNLIPCKNRPLFMPIGIMGEYNSPTDLKDKIEGIIFCGQIKSTSTSEEQLFCGEYGKVIKMFCKEYMRRMDNSFELLFYNFFGKLSLDVQKRVFKPINTYFRAWKRVMVIKKIVDYPVYIIGDVLDESIKNKSNVHILDKMPYIQSWNEVSRYMFSLNINPNFCDSIHDRILRSIECGTMPISEEGNWCREIFGDIIPIFNNEDLEIEKKILSYSRSDYIEGLRNLQSKSKIYRWRSILKELKRNCQE